MKVSKGEEVLRDSLLHCGCNLVMAQEANWVMTQGMTVQERKYNIRITIKREIEIMGTSKQSRRTGSRQ